MEAEKSNGVIHRKPLIDLISATKPEKLIVKYGEVGIGTWKTRESIVVTYSAQDTGEAKVVDIPGQTCQAIEIRFLHHRFLSYQSIDYCFGHLAKVTDYISRDY